jgi:hypothetical protein
LATYIYIYIKKCGVSNVNGIYVYIYILLGVCVFAACRCGDICGPPLFRVI